MAYRTMNMLPTLWSGDGEKFDFAELTYKN